MSYANSTPSTKPSSQSRRSAHWWMAGTLASHAAWIYAQRCRKLLQLSCHFMHKSIASKKVKNYAMRGTEFTCYETQEPLDTI
ncbi:hypothetical protein IFM47457_10978 [Aspergillus lentulus]|nr:hypothetical protein IFM47457_10978 [Aspergillus lentulus]